MFDARLKSYLAEKKRASCAITKHPMAQAIIDHAVRLSMEGGKRIRPYLGYLGYVAAGGREDVVIDALVGLELFHIFALIHDDIIDRAPARRGVPTIHVHIETLMPCGRSAAHKALSQAILAGDLVYAWSHDALAASLDARSRERVQKHFYRMIEEVILGQMIDVDIAGRPSCPRHSLEEKNLLKTARYTFVHPLMIGAALAGRDNALRPFFEAFGTHAGTAFQMRDDVLDVAGDPGKTGKSLFADIAEGQHTHLTDYIAANGTSAERALLARHFGKRISARHKQDLARLFTASGAIAASMRAITRRMAKAEALIDGAPMNRKAKASFRELARSLAGRSA